MKKSDPGSQAGLQTMPGDERRRSQRVMIRIQVSVQAVVSGQRISVRAVTASVNDHGAMLLCARSFAPNTQIDLENEHTRQKLPCRVTRAPAESPEGYLIPVEFKAPAEGFWQISFPPANWRPPDD